MRNQTLERAALLVMLMPLLAACKNSNAGPPPGPVELTRNVNGYYCGMIVADHPGPKAQIHLNGRAEPIFFASVVDAIAFLMLPGESKAIRAVYVNDMGRAHNWETPEPGTWIDANEAAFVLDSRQQSGMGQKEAVPFATPEAAKVFVSKYGGRIAHLSEIPASYIFPASDEGDAQREHKEAIR